MYEIHENEPQCLISTIGFSYQEMSNSKAEKKMEKVINPGIRLSTANNSINKILLAVLLQTTESDLQNAIYRSNQICKNYNLKISEKRRKLWLS